MCAKLIENNESPDAILTNLKEASKSSGIKCGRFDAICYRETVSSILSYIKFDAEIPECEKSNLVRQAFAEINDDHKLTVNELLKTISKKENIFLKTPIIDYLALSSVSMKFSDKLKPIKILGNVISFYKTPTNKFETVNIYNAACKKLVTKAPTNYTWITVNTKGRTPFQAMGIANDTMDLFRGVWNFFLNLHVIAPMFGNNDHKPINKIILGPISTLHNTRGKSIFSDTWWSDPFYQGPLPLYDVEKRWDYTKKQIDFIIKRLNKSIHNKMLAEAFIRYACALDDADLNNSYLKLWGLLEHLTMTKNAKYDQTVHRAVSLCKDVTLHRQLLNHLRDRRNDTVHKAQRQEDVVTIIYQLKRYCERLILFFLNDADEFQTTEEMTQYLDAPHNEITIERKIILLKKSLQFRKKMNPTIKEML